MAETVEMMVGIPAIGSSGERTFYPWGAHARHTLQLSGLLARPSMHPLIQDKKAMPSRDTQIPLSNDLPTALF